MKKLFVMLHKSLKKTMAMVIGVIAVAMGIVMLTFFTDNSWNSRSSFLQNPEDNHLIGDGVYFNVFTGKTRGQETTGIFSGVDSSTVFYASIQNAGKDRHMKLKGYLNYVSCPLEFLDESYAGDDIYLLDGDNIIIPFTIKSDIDPNTNYKLLLSLFLGTDQHEGSTHYQTTQHTMSYDYFIKNNPDSQTVDLALTKDISTQYTVSDFPGIVINEDFENTESVKLPPYSLKVEAGETFELSYKLGHITTDSALLLITINYEQAILNNSATALLIETPEGHLASGTISLTAPSTKGEYEICAVAVPSPSLSNPFELLENSYRFTLDVQ